MRKFAAVLCLLLTGIAGAETRRRSVRGPASPPPLEEQDLRIATLEFGSVDVQPGEHRTLRLWVQHCCVYSLPVDAAIRFSMDPNPYATIDAFSGELTIASDAPGGLTFRVYGNIENDRRLVSADVHVVTPQTHPLRGRWRQRYEIQCLGPFIGIPSEPIQELLFRGDGTFSVTWFPFEVYKDYWGAYSVNKPAGRITMAITGGNYIPPSFRGDGSFTVQEIGGKRVLHIEGISFGTRRGQESVISCGAEFESY